MAEGKPSKSWAEQLKDLEDPAPKGNNLLFTAIEFQASNQSKILIQRTNTKMLRAMMPQALPVMEIRPRRVNTMWMLGTQLTNRDIFLY